jgi:hypothetical protein
VEKRRNKLNDLFLAKQIGLVLKDSKMVQNLKGLFPKVKNFGVFLSNFGIFGKKILAPQILISAPQFWYQHLKQAYSTDSRKKAQKADRVK